MSTEHRRYPELDALRGIAVLLMIAYHLAFDLSFFYGIDIPLFPNEILARSIAAVFLLLIGICYVISVQRTAPGDRWKKSWKRALLVLAGAAVVSGATWIFDPASFVRFGILHLIGVSALLQPLPCRLRRWNILLGASVLLTLLVLPQSGSAWLLPFGFMPSGFFSVDYYPLLPWFGVILLGMGIGDVLYVPKQAAILHRLSALKYPSWLLWIGRRALVLYVVHQPIILLVLWMTL